MVFPYGVMISALEHQRMLNKNKKETNTRKENTSKEKEVFVDEEVDEITIKSKEGEKRTLKKGISIELISDHEASLNCKNIKREDLETLIDILISVKNNKDILN